MRFRVAIFEDYNAPEVVKISWAAKGITPLSRLFITDIFFSRYCRSVHANIAGAILSDTSVHRYSGAKKLDEEMSRRKFNGKKKKHLSGSRFRTGKFI